MKINTSFTFDKVDYSKENDIHAVISLKAPKIEWEKKRPAICVIPVIDVSGSMAGDKLEYAKQSVLKLIDNLAPGDYCGLVAFDTYVQPLAEPRELSQGTREQLKAKVGNLNSGSSTNFSGGMRQALEWINKVDVNANMILRVIMFTDGNANAGECNGRDMIGLCKKLLGKATLSCFGYGSDCDQELLADMAKEAKGNYAFIRNPDDAMTAFAKELGGLLSRYAQDIVIDVAPVGGHRIVEVLSDVDVEEDGDKVKIKIHEVLSEEDRNIVLAIKTSVQTKVLPRELNVLDVRVTYDELTGGEKKHVEQCVKGKLEFVDASDAQKDPTKEIMAIVGIAMTVQAQIKAEELAKQGNFAAASNTLVSNAAKMDSFQLHDHGGMSRGLAANYGSHASYSASAGQRYSLKRGLSRSAGTVDNESEKILASVGLCSSNSGIDAAVQAFTGGGGTVSPAAPLAGAAAAMHSAVVGGGIVAGSFIAAQPSAPDLNAHKPKAQEKKPGPAKKKSKRW